MQRFYIPSPGIKDDTVTITDHRVVYQCGKVLRMHAGHEFSIFDEQEAEHKVRILEIGRHKILCQVMEKLERHTELTIKISLYQAVPKKPALFELVVQKATELGVAEIFPLITKRTEKRRLSKFERLTAIATEASEQCNRTRVPIIHHPVSFETAVSQIANGYMAYEFQEEMSLLDYGKGLEQGGALQILIGPEGGFTQKEVELAKKTHVHPFTLGPRILRTETAALASLAQLLHLFRKAR